MNENWMAEVPRRFPWILQRQQHCILSPDCDGLLCGLFMSHFLDWRIKGFYDGKVMAVEDGVAWRDCVFLDMEIYREGVRSSGQHMLMVNNNHRPKNWRNFDNCISPNNLRGFDFNKSFKRKYPLGEIHLLMAILSNAGIAMQWQADAIQPLLYVDGTFKNLLNYPENCLDWFQQLRVEENALGALFCADTSVHSIMRHMQCFFADIERLSIKSATNRIESKADKVSISNRDGAAVNFTDANNHHTKSIREEERRKCERFLQLLADKTQWRYCPDNWAFENLNVRTYSKISGIQPTVKHFNHIVEQETPPLSWAVISRASIEMTVPAAD